MKFAYSQFPYNLNTTKERLWLFTDTTAPPTNPLRRDKTHDHLFNMGNPSAYTLVMGQNLPNPRIREIGHKVVLACLDSYPACARREIMTGRGWGRA